MSKLTEILEAHLPKEREIIKPYYSEVNGYQEQYNKQVKDNQINFGFNSCLAEIKKALPDMEEDIMKNYRKQIEIFCLTYPTVHNKQVFSIPVGYTDKLLRDFLTSITK